MFESAPHLRRTDRSGTTFSPLYDTDGSTLPTSPGRCEHVRGPGGKAQDHANRTCCSVSSGWSVSARFATQSLRNSASGTPSARW